MQKGRFVSKMLGAALPVQKHLHSMSVIVAPCNRRTKETIRGNDYREKRRSGESLRKLRTHSHANVVASYVSRAHRFCIRKNSLFPREIPKKYEYVELIYQVYKIC